MRKHAHLQSFPILLLAFSTIPNTLLAQTDLGKLIATILHQDSLFWKTYTLIR
ncbi:MAG: hypothetical protein KIS77_12835 [Saprospiraceae bacterium]|nr:hypothetical protein [Saprospiraceae bacterium]